MELMQRRRELMAMQSGFNYLDPKTWYIATAASHRQRSPWGINRIERNEKQVTLTRNNEFAGLVFRLGKLIAGKQYTLSCVYTNADGKAYIGRITSGTDSEYECVRDFTLSFSNGAVSFTPQYTAEYDFLLWRGGRYTISAENVKLTEN